AAARARAGVSADGSRRRAGTLPRRGVRSGDLGIRRLPLGGPGSLGLRGGTNPATGRRADLPRELGPLRPLRAGGDRRNRRAAPPPGLRHATRRGARRSRRRGPPLPRQLDPRAAAERVRRRRPDAGAAAAVGDDELRLRHARLGETMAVRRDLARATPIAAADRAPRPSMEERWTTS